MASSPRITLQVTAVPVFSVAMAHNGVGVLGDLRITNNGPGVRGAELRVTVFLPEPDPVVGGAVPVPADGESCRGCGVDLGSVTVPIDLPTVGTAAPTAVPSPLETATVAAITGPVDGVVRVEVLVDGRPEATENRPIRVLGANRWAAAPVTLALEMLAAFVLPQDPALDAVLGGGGDPGAGHAGAGVTDPGHPEPGYLDGPESVDERARAIFDALRDRGIRLLEPDPGWPGAPQRIRGPGQVLQDGDATALEVALLLAAALERTGLHPLVWIGADGPLVGYWREDRSLPAAAVTDIDGVVNLVDLGLLGTVDPTLATASVPDADFRRAVAACHPRLHGDLTELVGVLDVRSARRDHIDPLPARVTGRDGTVRSVGYSSSAGTSARSVPAAAGPAVTGTAGLPAPTRHAGAPAAARPAPGAPAPRAPAPSEEPARVAQWKNALLDLSLRNRLLNYTGRGAVNLAVPPGLLGALEDTVNSGGRISLLASDQLSDVQIRRGIRSGRELTEEHRADLLSSKHAAYTDIPTDSYPSRMRSLAYRARTIAEETGANHLYLALGTLLWTLDGRSLRSPVILVPVTLSPRSRHGTYRVELDEAGTSTPNYCLTEKLRQVHGLSIPGLAEPVEDSAGIDLDAAFRALRSALADAGLNYRVEQTADLALLAFAKFRLWKDLDEHWTDLARNPLVDHLISSPTATFTDPAKESPKEPDLDALAAQVPIAADASQLDAIAAATEGRTFVLEGPPGTGKSQTITNLLAHAIAQGRRVLFVAEKRAALDVVTRRLDAIGLAPFCLDLHDKKAKPATVRAQIRAALELRIAADEQGLAAVTEQLQSAGGQLERYATRLHEPNAAGLSYYSAHTRALAVGDGPVLPIPESAVVATDIDLAAARAAVTSLPDVADPARPSADHPWGFVDPPDPAGVDAAALASAALAVDDAIGVSITAPAAAAALAAARTPSDVRNLARFGAAYAVDLALLDLAATDRWRREAEAARTEVAAFASAAHPGLEVVSPEVFALPVDAIDADARTANASSWFGRKKRQLAVLARLQPALRPGVTVPRKQIGELTGRLAGVWRQIVQLQVRVAAVDGLQPPDGWNPLTSDGRRWLDDRIGWLTWASDAASLRDRTGGALPEPGPFRQAVRHLLVSREVVGLNDQDAITRLADALGELGEMSGGDRAVGRWARHGLVSTWRASAGGRRAAEAGQPVLRRYLALLEHLQPLRHAGLHDARSLLLSGAVPADRAARAFDSGLAAASLAERGAATGLDAFEPTAHDRAVQRFAQASERLRDQLMTAIPAGVLASRTFDATSSFGQVGELSRELAKQRRGLAVRPLLARYGGLVTAVMPCMLVSPDSLARFFPPQSNLFDLVVFDEASQIRVADAIGALGRARAAVVVGDSKQMPPTSVAESTADPLLHGSDPGAPGEESADDLLGVPDEESILSECVQAGVPRRWLSWHYRSQDEALIAFSNRRYYDDRLSTFPSPLHGSADPGLHGHGVNLVRVRGRFLRSHAGKLLRTNPVEADAVVAELRRRFEADPDSTPSVGVVTFNAQQRTLIESLLRDLGDDRIIEALDRTDGEGLFVKNLENVQGDERDVILFSTAFSANDRGVLPLNFGPLNQVGGERRLNVAVTRARRQVLVFCSFDPEDLRAGETSSRGIKDLRAYLEVARAGVSSVIGSSPKAPAPDRHRDEVAAAAKDRGLSVATNVGLSDFTLDLAVGTSGGDGNPGRPRVAVLLDGPEWAARRTVGDRDRLPVEVLSGLMHWPAVQRIWLPDWLRDSESVLDRLQAATRAPAAASAEQTGAVPGERAGAMGSGDMVAAADPVDDGSAVQPRDRWEIGSSGPGTATIGAPSDGASSATATAPGSVGSADGTPFTPWISGYLGPRDVLDGLPARRCVDRVRRALLAAVEAEGPIHVDRLAKLVAGGFDLARVSAERRSAILDCLPPGVFRDPADPLFAWPEDVDPADWGGFRRTGTDADRPLEYVCSREIGNAMVAICTASAGADRDQLDVETLRVFDLHRRTTAALALLDAALRRATAEGRLTCSGGVFRGTGDRTGLRT